MSLPCIDAVGRVTCEGVAREVVWEDYDAASGWFIREEHCPACRQDYLERRLPTPDERKARQRPAI